MTGIDPNVLLAIVKVETDWGRAREGQPDELVPADIRANVDAAALQSGGTTAVLLGPASLARRSRCRPSTVLRAGLDEAGSARFGNGN